jgi:cyanophycinase
MMDSSPFKPIYALADSQLLFWRRPDDSLSLDDVVKNLGGKPRSAAYIGASNGDDLRPYHDIFEPAMQQIGVAESRMILSRPMPEEGAFLERADIILLAGGSVEIGWRAFERNGVKELIQRRRLEGALLMGISAGAVQLGRGGLTDDESKIMPTFGFLPFYVGAHEERDDWRSLRKLVTLVPESLRAIGIPFGGGIVYHEGELTPVHKPLFELCVEDGNASESSIFPYDP